jgi:replicative DNA helicase
VNQQPRSLPYSEDAEKGLLCSMILSADVLLECASKGEMYCELFYAPAHRMIFSALCDSADEGIPVDFVTLKNRLEQDDQLAEIGGRQFLNDLFTFVPTASNWRYYAELVLDYYDRRVTIIQCQRLIERMYDTNDPAAEIVGPMVETILTKLALSIAESEKSFSQLVVETLEEIDARAKEEKNDVLGARFDLSTLDNELGGGVQSGEFCVISGQTSMGKSALALHPILSLARASKSVALFSFEMPATQVVERILAHQGDLSMRTIRTGKFLSGELAKLHLTAKRIRDYLIFVEQNAFDINELVSRCRYLKLRREIGLVVVDYLQLVRPALTRSRETNREREVADISRKLKTLALELKIPVIALSQLNDQGRLRESRAIGQDADIVLKIEESDSDNAFAVDVLIDKHRGGARNKRVTLEFFGEYMQFRELPKRLENE